MTDSPAPTPREAILYLRLSDDRNENGSFPEREAKLRRHADRLGWTVVGVVVENDSASGKSRSASAFKRRKITLPNGETALRVVRPGFRGVLADLVAGRAHALVAEDLDRIARDPRDLEDLFDVVEARGLSADSDRRRGVRPAEGYRPGPGGRTAGDHGHLARLRPGRPPVRHAAPVTASATSSGGGAGVVVELRAGPGDQVAEVLLGLLRPVVRGRYGGNVQAAARGGG